jgi:cytochrome d ubiquinol oxidase subunit II
MFAMSSVLTPFFLGSVVGGVASGRVPAVGTGSLLHSWLNPTSVLGGVLAVVVCAFLAAVYLAADADHQDDEALTAYFRARAIASGIVAGVVAAVGIAVLHSDSRRLFAHLTGRAFPILVASAVAGIATLVMLVRGRCSMARITAAAAVVTVVWGWAAGQYPYLIDGRLTIAQAAGAHATLQALLGAVAAGIVVIGPALAWLLLLARRGDLHPTSEQVSGQPGNAG